MKHSILILVIITLSSVRGFTAPDDIMIEEPEQRCYICGRTISDFEHIHQKVVTQLEDQATRTKQQLDTSLEKRVETHNRIQTATRDNPNMSLTVHTVKTDLETFNRIIPYLEEMIAYYDKYELRLSLGSASRLKLSDLLMAMGSLDTPEMVSYRKRLDYLTHSLKNYTEMSDSLLSFEMFKLTTDFSHLNPDLANPERTRSGAPISVFDLALRLRREWEASKDQVPIGSILDRGWKAIVDDKKTPERDRTRKYEQFKAYFFGYHQIEYSVFVCPICLTLLSPERTIYRRLRYNDEYGFWDSNFSNFP